MTEIKDCTGNKACDCAKKAMSEGANRNWVESIEDNCPFRKREVKSTLPNLPSPPAQNGNDQNQPQPPGQTS